MVRSNDTLRKHPAFLKAAKGAIEIYLQLEKEPYQAPSAANGSHSVNGTDGEAAEDQKKKKATEEAKKPAKSDDKKNDGADDADKPPVIVDDDPNGDKLVATKTPLEALDKFLDHIEALGAENPDVQDISFQVAMRKSEWMVVSEKG